MPQYLLRGILHVGGDGFIQKREFETKWIPFEADDDADANAEKERRTYFTNKALFKRID